MIFMRDSHLNFGVRIHLRVLINPPEEDDPDDTPRQGY